MSAEIISLADVRASRKIVKAAIVKAGVATATQPVAPSSEQGPRFHFWTGASGKRYVHTVYSLFDCPPVGMANYVLVKRDGKTQRQLLAIGRVLEAAASLNLAQIRQRGAALGADEVHIHLLAATASDSHAVEIDLKTAQFAALSG